MNNRTPLIVANNVQKSFAETTILAGISLSLKAGETLSIAGASGSGKTTLLHLLGGLDKPDGGDISIGGKKWQEMNAAESAQWRNRMLGFVFQFHLLLPEFSAIENAAMPLLLRRIPRAEALEIAAESLRQLGLATHANKTPEKLSGGERQRVAVARAMTGCPACLLADEPTGNLDRKNAEAVFALMLEAAAAQNMAVIVVSHDDRLAAQTQRQTAILDGKLSE